MTKRKSGGTKNANIFGNTTVLDYAQFHVPVSVYRHWSELELRLYLFLMETMSKADSRSVVLTAADIFKETGIHDSQLGKVRDGLQSYGVIAFRTAKGFRGGWSYEALNSVTGERIKALDYIRKDGLTRAQIERYADTRLRRSNLSIVGDSSILATCPLCGSDGAFSLRLPDPGNRGHGEWHCAGECRAANIARQQNADFRGTRATDSGKLIDLELAVMRLKRRQTVEYRSALYSVERIVQNKHIDFDPDDGYVAVVGTLQSKLDDQREEVLGQARYNPDNINP